MTSDQVRDKIIEASPAHAALVMARDRVAREYCSTKGWAMENISVAQILEIRALPEWKNPPGTTNDNLTVSIIL